MKLDQYMTLRKLDDASFAKLIQRDRTTVYRLRTGKCLPDWATVAAISKETEGAVTANDFVPDEPALQSEAAQ